MGSTSTFTVASGSSIAGGNAVSLDSSGVLQAGAGTSIYRNIVDIVATCPRYLNMDAISDDSYLISYSDGQTTSLQVVTVDADTPNKGTVVQTETVQQTIADMVTLSQSTGLFVGICQDQEIAATQDYIVAGFVDPVTHVISPLMVSDQYAITYSVVPLITRLSDTAFAIAYTKAVTPQVFMTRYGKNHTCTPCLSHLQNVKLLAYSPSLFPQARWMSSTRRLSFRMKLNSSWTPATHTTSAS